MVYIKTKALWKKQTIVVVYNKEIKELFCSSNPLQDIPKGYKRQIYYLPFNIHPTKEIKTGWIKRKYSLLRTYYSGYTKRQNPISKWEVKD